MFVAGDNHQSRRPHWTVWYRHAGEAVSKHVRRDHVGFKTLFHQSRVPGPLMLARPHQAPRQCLFTTDSWMQPKPGRTGPFGY